MNTFTQAACGVLLAYGLASSPALAQSDWPTRPIIMVVPFPPGGVTDTVARPVAEAMGRALKQPVVIENRGGAGGGVGMAHVAKATPDGYTILMALPSVSIIPEADRISGRPAMYQVSQLEGIARFTADPTALTVRADSPWKNLADFVADARKREITYGSSGSYGTLHIYMEAFRSEANLRMQHIPYTGAGPAIVALMGGQIDAVAASPASVLPHVKSGRLKVLAHWGQGRLASMPDVPSLTEAGYPVEFAQWSGLFVPAGTPRPIVEKLRAAAKAAATDEKVNRVIEGAGIPMMYMDTPEFRSYWANDAQKLTRAIQKIGKVD
jgi:tripartite-type tricarboxylate transporter receptor subunit TctC